MSQALPYQLINFKQDVLEQSQHIPVLVDYWASWCEPCKFLSPIIEKLASESSGKWKLIKINTEEHSDIAEEWGVRGIPNLKLFYKGKVIADLAGAMAEPEMREWIDRKLPSEAKSLAIEASELIAEGNTENGIYLLEKAINMDNELTEARLLLGKLLIWDKPERVPLLVECIKHVEEAEELMILADFMMTSMANLKEGGAKKLLEKAGEFLKCKEIEPAVEVLIQAIIVDKQYQNELARRLTIAIFHILGEASEITKKYRRRFDMLLY